MIRILCSALRQRIPLQIAIAVAAMLMWIAPVPKLEPLTVTDRAPPAIISLPPDGNPPQMQQLITRPVFTASRRPPTAVPIALAKPLLAAAKPAPNTDGIVLLGVLHNGQKAIALVSSPGEPSPREIGLGAVLGDWTVTKILDDGILLKSGDTNSQLLLPLPTASPANPTSPTPSPFSFPTPPATSPSSHPLFFPNSN